MFYLMMHSTHCINGYMVKDHSNSERKTPLPSFHGILFLISIKESFICNHAIHRIAHTMAFVMPVVEHWLKKKLANRSAMKSSSTELGLASYFTKFLFISF